MIRHLLSDLEQLDSNDFEVIVTVNIPEDESVFSSQHFPLRIVRNTVIKGFGANHNAAFKLSSGEFFVVTNPDIRAPELQFAEFRKVFNDASTGACAPVVRNSRRVVEDNARRFPTVMRLMRRVLLRERRPDYQFDLERVNVDWIAGMFMVLRRRAFEQVGGFDAKRYFMYYEDVDLCARLKHRGWTICVQPTTEVIHDAQRASHRNLKHLRWHLTSAMRYLSGF